METDGFVRQRKELERLLMSDPSMEKKVQALIRKVLFQVRAALSREARAAIGSDPRQAYKAVKTAVWRQLLGGSVSILQKRRAGGSGSYEPSRHPSPRGGNRRPRSARTAALDAYYGSDRGFVLRFLNAGTEERAVRFSYDPRRESVRRGSRGGNLRSYGKTVNTGYRGRIKARNWFGPRSQREMEKAARNLELLIGQLIEQQLK